MPTCAGLGWGDAKQRGGLDPKPCGPHAPATPVDGAPEQIEAVLQTGGASQGHANRGHAVGRIAPGGGLARMVAVQAKAQAVAGESAKWTPPVFKQYREGRWPVLLQKLTDAHGRVLLQSRA